MKDLDRLPSEFRESLLNLGHMAVACDPIRMQPLGDFGEKVGDLPNRIMHNVSYTAMKIFVSIVADLSHMP